MVLINNYIMHACSYAILAHIYTFVYKVNYGCVYVHADIIAALRNHEINETLKLRAGIKFLLHKD